jgi:hypothetical protein
MKGDLSGRSGHGREIGDECGMRDDIMGGMFGG